MMQLKRKTFVGVLVTAVGFGLLLGLFAQSRAQLGRLPAPVAGTPEAPIVLVQGPPLTPGTFAKIAEAIRPFASVSFSIRSRPRC